ncbi:12083_t:CDS:2, partial [Cetraspora pellucida]
MSHDNNDDDSGSEYHDAISDGDELATNINSEIYITFHVHMPEKLDGSMHPIVVGNIKELGGWKRPVVKLHQIEPNSTYWVSDRIRIYVKESDSPRYKYAIYRPKTSRGFWSAASNWVFGDQTIIMEGNSDKDNRELSYKENQYDVWKTNYFKNLYEPDINHEFKFVFAIYESVTLENFKDKVMEFQRLLKQYSKQTVQSISIDSILNYFSRAHKNGQKIFTCVMLAYHIEEFQRQTSNRVKLPEKFPSADLLQILQEIQIENPLPKSAERPFTLATSALVKHNSLRRNSFDWMKMFSVAPILDPTYLFLSQIEKHKYTNKNEVQTFHNLLKINVKPHLDEIDKIKDRLLYQKVIKTIITISYFGIESYNFLVHEIIEKKNIDNDISGLLCDLISKDIESDNPCELEQHFKSFSGDIRDGCLTAFRNRFTNIILNNDFTWNSACLNSFFMLFSQLFTTESEVVQVLELLSKSKNIDLLHKFPNWLKIAWESKDNKQLHKKIPSICEVWYSNITSTSQKGQNIVSLMYKQLSEISFIFKRRPDIYKQLIEIIEKRIANISIQLLLQSTSFVGRLEAKMPNICKDFARIFNDKFDPLINSTDDIMITNIVHICDSSLQSLVVPNKLCENTVYHILDIIRNKIAASGEFNASNDEKQILLLKHSKFWSFLLNAAGEVNELHAHPQMKYVRSQIIKLVNMINNKSIQMGLLESLTELKNDELIRYFNSGIGFENEEQIITGEILDFLREKSHEHSDTAKQLFSFYHKWCYKAEDCQLYVDDLTQKMETLKDVTLADFDSTDYWFPHTGIIDISQKVYQYEKFLTFANMVENNTKDEIQTSVLHVAEMFKRSVIEQYQKTCNSYKNWQNINYSEAKAFWKDITKEQVKHELERMSGDTSLYRRRNQVQNGLVASVECLVLIPRYIAQLKCLLRVFTQFKVRDADKSWVAKMLQHLEDDDMRLSELPGIFQELNKHLNELDEYSWTVVKELSSANEFITYLLENLIGRDLTNLINGFLRHHKKHYSFITNVFCLPINTTAVDDQSDTKLLQENTVAALIEVNKALNPLNNDSARLSTTSFLKCLSEISRKHPSLAEKISSCGSHNLALQNMHRNIAKRGEVTKERIKNAATIGFYIFEHNEKSNSCELTLKYDTKHNQHNDAPRVTASYNIAELRDLYGRALLIGKSRASTDHSIDDDGNEDISILMNQFVMQVDLSQQITTVASRLIQYGHFLYQRMRMEVDGTTNLQYLVDKLNDDMKNWEKIVDQAQNEHYYLTFFSARHILAFYDYFRNVHNENDNLHMSNQETCQNLIRFVNDEAQLPQLHNFTDEWLDIQSEADFLPTLRKI